MGPVLVGLDGSPESEAALRWADWYGRRTNRAVHVAHAWQHGKRLEPLLPSSRGVSNVEDLEAGLRARVEEITAEVLGDSSRVAEHLVLRGPTAGALLEQARAHEGTLLVVGARGAGGALRTLLGSVTQELTQYPAQPVVIVPRDVSLPESGRWTIVVGVDGSTGASRALRWALGNAARDEAHVVAVHAVEFPEADLTRDERTCVLTELRHRLEDEWCAPLRAAGVPFTTVVEPGPPADVIRKAAEAADPECVVLGSRGLGGFSQRLLGSVTYRLVRELDWPTVVIPGPRDCVRWDIDAIG